MTHHIMMQEEDLNNERAQQMKTHCVRVKRTLVVNCYIKAETLEEAMDRALRMEGVVEVLGEGKEYDIYNPKKIKWPRGINE